MTALQRQRPMNGAQLANQLLIFLPPPAHDLQHGMFESKGRLDWLFGSACVHQRLGTRLRFALSADTLCRLPRMESCRCSALRCALSCRVTVRCGGMPGDCFVS